MTEIDQPNPVHRLDRMERQCQRQADQIRWMKIALVFLPLIGVIGGAAFQNQHLTANTVTAQRFVVKSEDGKTRAVLQTEAGETSFKMFTDDEKLALAIRLQRNGIVSWYQFYTAAKPSFCFGFVTTPEGMSSFALRRPEGKVLIGMDCKATDIVPEVGIGEARQRLQLH
jgi:hypothetical protein